MDPLLTDIATADNAQERALKFMRDPKQIEIRKQELATATTQTDRDALMKDLAFVENQLARPAPVPRAPYRLESGVTVAPSTAPAPVIGRSLEDLYAAAKGPRPLKAPKLTKTAEAISDAAKIGLLAPIPDTEAKWLARSTPSADAARKQVQEREDASLLDVSRAQVMSFGIVPQIVRRMARPEFEPDGTTASEDELVGLTVDEADHVRQGSSKQARQFLRWEVEEEKERQKDAAKGGTGMMLLGGLIAGLPEGAVAGVGLSATLARAGYGSVQLASQGRRGAATLSSVGENVAANVALTGAEDALSPFVNKTDYALAAGMGAAVHLLHAPSLRRAGEAADDLNAVLRVAEDARIEREADIKSARAIAGPDATNDEVAKLALAAQGKRLREAYDAPLQNPGDERKLLSNDIVDELTGDTTGKTDGEPPLPKPETTEALSTTDLIRQKAPDAKTREDMLSAAEVQWDSPAYLQGRIWSARSRPETQEVIGRLTGGRTYDDMVNLPVGVTVAQEAAANPKLALAIKTINELIPKYAKGDKVHVTVLPPGKPQGEVLTVGNVHMIALADTAPGLDRFAAGMHEVGHVVWHKHAQYVPAELMKVIKDDFGVFMRKLLSADPSAAQHRLSILNPSAAALGNGRLKPTAYAGSLDEYIAEQYVKHLTTLAFKGDKRISDTLRSKIIQAVKAVLQFFTELKARGHLRPDAGAAEFFERVLDGTLQQAKKVDEEMFLSPDLVIPSTSASQGLEAVQTTALTDEALQAKHGLDVIPDGTPAQRTKLKAMTHLFRKAEGMPKPDEKRMSKLLLAKPLSALTPTALRLLASDHPVARMAGALLVENGAGAAGRTDTAAIRKWRYEREFMGNAVNDYERSYVEWRNANGGSLKEDFWDGAKKQEFDRLVATEMENRLAGRVSQHPPAVHDAADVLEAAYDRLRKAQVNVRTPGYQALPSSSFGYMPHRMSPDKVRNASPAQIRVLHGVLVEQFRSIEGFDEAFSRRLASKYIETIKDRATTGYSAPMTIASAEAADIVEQAAKAMGLGADEAHALSRRMLKSQPAHTRHRLQLDLTREYRADGQTFKLLDLFETDQMQLLRSQVSRVSGEVALIQQGVPGSVGLKLIREAMADYGAVKADNATLEAFDQVAAELLGQPFGKQNGPWLDRAVQFNSVASLGGMGFNQLAEFWNGAVSLGVRHALSAIGDFGRLRSEIIALSKGEKVDNPIIGSLELYGVSGDGGAQFGTDNYKMIFPFASADRIEVTYGKHDITALDRILRGGMNLQGKLSLWRAITAAQERGFAEQIVHKVLRYVREGGEDVALADIGIDKATAAGLRASLKDAARFDANGRLVSFDISKVADKQAAETMVNSVHRGTRQIIQGSLIGETGKWIHSDLLRLALQFKTFSLTAIDKQWNRQVGNHGTAAALGMLLGTMTLAAPIYMVRVGLQSIGREDQDEFLEKRLHPYRIAREVLNYTALSGLSGDLLDVMSSITGVEPTGGRSGTNKSAVGNVVAPAAGKVDDIWRALQNTKEGTDIHGLMMQMPFSRLPFMYPAMNALRPDN